MLVYHSDENTTVCKQQKVIRGELWVFWKSNHKAWVTRQLFYEWVSEDFCPSVKFYLTKNKMELKALFLILGNAPGHDPEFAPSLTVKFPFIREKFLPANSTSLKQCMVQQMIANFRGLRTKKIIYIFF
jgi:hypothetical protein